MTKISKREDLLTICVLGLLGLLAINYVGDYAMFYNHDDRLDKHTEKLLDIQVWNFQQDIEFKQMDEDVRSNYKVVDQLIGIILRDEI